MCVPRPASSAKYQDSEGSEGRAWLCILLVMARRKTVERRPLGSSCEPAHRHASWATALDHLPSSGCCVPIYMMDTEAQKSHITSPHSWTGRWNLGSASAALPSSHLHRIEWLRNHTDWVLSPVHSCHASLSQLMIISGPPFLYNEIKQQ